MPADLDDTALAHTRTGSPEPAIPVGTDALATGARLGHFRIEKKLGAGGMGEVYLATDLALDRPVAIKVLPAGSTSAAARDRMVREARAQARIHHANVAHIYFIGEDAGRLYFAMEYLSGKTLAERIAGGPLAIDDALAVIRAAVLGLREAQRSGFTHRDVKPSNLMVDEHGVVKVLDFGLVAAGAGSADGPVEQTSLAGTPLYMAPEQARGEPIDLRADIYSLGATLYHLVSGRPPFAADSAAELVSLHASAERPTLPRGANKRVAISSLDALIGKMMAASPADRFASYDELLRAVEQLSIQHTRPAGFWVRGFATAIDVVIAVILVGLLGLVSQVIGGDDSGPWPIAALFGAYTTLAIGWRGTTLGKALFELELASIHTGVRPRWRQVVTRQLGFVAPAAVLAFAKAYLANDSTPHVVVAISLYTWWGLGFLELAYATLGRAGKRTWWDRISHTQVRYRVSRAAAGALLP